METVAAIAGAFHMDPVDVWKGSDYDLGLRMGAERVLRRLIDEAKFGG
jgi:hypothetical protein